MVRTRRTRRNVKRNRRKVLRGGKLSDEFVESQDNMRFFNELPQKLKETLVESTTSINSMEDLKEWLTPAELNKADTAASSLKEIEAEKEASAQAAAPALAPVPVPEPAPAPAPMSLDKLIKNIIEPLLDALEKLLDTGELKNYDRGKRINLIKSIVKMRSIIDIIKQYKETDPSFPTLLFKFRDHFYNLVRNIKLLSSNKPGKNHELDDIAGILDYFDLEKDDILRKKLNKIDVNRDFMIRFQNWVKGQSRGGAKKSRKRRKTTRRKTTRRKTTRGKTTRRKTSRRKTSRRKTAKRKLKKNYMMKLI
jgi:hypothetical protein